MSNITRALLHSGTICKTAPLYQYDYGQILQIVGVELPEAYEVHFSNQPHGVATTQIGSADGVTVPDMYLLSGETVYAWVYLHTGEDDGETEYSITIPVVRRASIGDDPPTPVEQSVITQAIAALDAAVTQTGQDVEAADAAKGAAQTAQGLAEDARDAAVSAKEDAVDAKADAIIAKSAAQAAQTAAESAAASASASATVAGNARDAAVTAKAGAESAASTASDASSAAQSAKAAAETAQGKAETAQSGAESAKAAAQTAQGQAQAAKTAAETAQGKAETAQTKAETAQGKAEDAQTAAESAQSAAESARSEAVSARDTAAQWATGGTSGTPGATNNAKYYSEQSASSAGTASSKAGQASTSANTATEKALIAEGYAVGKQNGTDVGSGSAYYHNNAKYYSEQASSSAASASNSAGAAQTAQGKAKDAQDAAESARDAVFGMSAIATTLAPGSSATASYSAGVLTLGIPEGEKGDTGDDGYSPSASVTKSGDISTITITDANGTTTADVIDGVTAADLASALEPIESDVSDLKSHIDSMTVEEVLLRSDIPGTTVVVTFDNYGNPSTITHSADGSAVRTDVFTWGESSVTEVRTASDKRITITTNLSTLAQTVSDIEEVA